MNQEGMSNQQLNSLLETLAKLIESKAITPEEAAQIVRDAKTTAKTEQTPQRRLKSGESKATGRQYLPTVSHNNNRAGTKNQEKYYGGHDNDTIH